MPVKKKSKKAEPVDQRLRNQLVKEGFAYEPPKHVRPKRGPCPYVETKHPKTGAEVSSAFTRKGVTYVITYVDGCFYPFIYKML